MGQQFTSIAKGLNLGGFQESKEEFLEKGKKAQIGEIREWRGQKFQKQPNGGWIPVKQGTKETKKEFSAEDEKWLDRFFDPMDTASAFLDSKELEKDYPNKTIEEFERYISENGQAEGWAVESLVSELHLSDKEATDLLRERNKKLLEEIKKDPEKYGFETEPENKAIAGVKDWIGDEASDHKIEKPSVEKKEEKKKFTPEQEKWLGRFFDPFSSVNSFMENSSDETYPNKSVEEFEKFISADDENGGEALGVDSLVSELDLSVKEATDLYKERSKKMLEDIKKNPKKYGF